jgi:predicted ATP-grasp superfamily ATP-dependent carboligase
MMSASRVVAVLDGEAVKAVPVVRALGEAGIAVHLFSFERLSPAAASRYCHRHTRLGWFDARTLRHILTERKISLVLPLEDRTMAALHADPDIWKDFTLIQPDAADLERFRDKAVTIDLAVSRNVPVPETAIPASLEQAESLLRQWRHFPVVIKPRISSGSRGIRVAADAASALTDYRRVHRDYPLPLLQRFVSPGGRALGVEFLFFRGREVRVFAHERLRQFPVKGGPSTYCRGCTDSRVVAMGRRMMEGLGYSGFAMVEFREDPESGTLYLMEVNPRPWGSIALPRFAGVDFAVEAVRVFASGGVDRGQPEVPADAADYHLRWLLPADFLNLLTDRSVSFRYRMRELFRRYPGTVYQILSRKDPCPAWVMLFKMVAGAFNPRFLWRNFMRR